MPITVLVVDDETAIQELVAEYLKGRGMQVIVSGRAADARVVLSRRPPDVVVTDIKLPDGDGTELIAEAASLDPPVRCVAVTGYATIDDAIAAFRAGAADYLLKPFRLRDLHAAVLHAYDLGQAQRLANWRDAALTLMSSAMLLDSPDGAEPLIGQLVHALFMAPAATGVILAEGDVVRAARGDVAAPPEASSFTLGSRWTMRLWPGDDSTDACVRAVAMALARVRA